MTSITADLTDGYAVELATESGHAWRADEPTSVGGTDRGPNPYELLLSALGACTAITISMYCEHKNWALEAVDATFTHDRVHAEDCADCDEPGKGYVDRIRGEIAIVGTFDEEQRARLEQVAARCPVRKTLSNGADISDEITFS